MSLSFSGYFGLESANADEILYVINQSLVGIGVTETTLQQKLTLVPEAFCNSFLPNFVARTASFIFLVVRGAESREKKASGLDCWESHFHAISF